MKYLVLALVLVGLFVSCSEEEVTLHDDKNVENVLVPQMNSDEDPKWPVTVNGTLDQEIENGEVVSFTCPEPKDVECFTVYKDGTYDPDPWEAGLVRFNNQGNYINTHASSGEVLLNLDGSILSCDMIFDDGSTFVWLNEEGSIQGPIISQF